MNNAGPDSTTSPGSDAPIFKTSIGRYVAIGVITSLVLVVGFGGWAAVANISGAVVAPGEVVVGSSVKEVAHEKGGIVKTIHVSSGDRVEKDALLIELDDTRSRAGRNQVAGRLMALRARMDRLAAERDNNERITFRPELSARSDEPAVAEVLRSQRSVFAARRETLEGQTAQLREQIAQLEEQIGGLDAQRDAKAQEIELVTDELEDLRSLLKRDLVPRSRVTAREREAVRLEGEKGDLTARIASANGRIAELRMQILQVEKEFQQQVLDEISKLQPEIASLAEQNVAASDELSRVELRAPEAGIVHELAVTTEGGVVSPAETLMKIVPETDDLVVEARVPPINIDEVKQGQQADVMFSGLPLRETPKLEGEVVRVSADRSVDESTGETYFEVEVMLEKDELERLGDVRLVPGMPAEVFIRTRDRTVLSYLIQPLMDAANLAFKET